MAFLAFDDTDSRQGGCTTHVAWRILEALDGLDVLGAPELVRLNPNVPFKTRGNGAVCLRLGQGRGRRRRVGVLPDGRDVWGFERGEELAPRELAVAFARAADLIEDVYARHPDTRPGLVGGLGRPPEPLYWRAVRDWVPAEEAARGALRHAMLWRAWNGGRGLIGALAAAAWTGRHDATWEAIGYRRPEAVGLPRRIDDDGVAALDGRFEGCFDSWDPTHRVARCVPASPCPVLVGVRGEDPGPAVEALSTLGPEESDGWLLWRSNQATDDHVEAEAKWRPWSSRLLRVRVEAEPVVRAGGHVFVRAATASGATTTLAAFEPTKEFRDPVRQLRRGDVVDAVGSFHADVGTLALERLSVVEAEDGEERRNPECDACGVRMKSRGRGAGYRCRRCHGRLPSEAAETLRRPRSALVGAYEVPVIARRHLSKPLWRQEAQNSSIGRRPA